tara:strand:- start:1175 stop:1510 length:336 start_codon:yes stop_codon:yes gene_type:complete
MTSNNDKLNAKKSWNKKDLTALISTKLGIPKSKANEYLNTFVDVISEGLIDGKKITISDFGSFSISERSGFKGTHPQTGEPINVTVRFIPVFKVGKKLKEALNPHLSDTDE